MLLSEKVRLYICLLINVICEYCKSGRMPVRDALQSKVWLCIECRVPNCWATCAGGGGCAGCILLKFLENHMAFMYYTCTHGTTVGVRMACGRKRMPGMAPAGWLYICAAVIRPLLMQVEISAGGKCFRQHLPHEDNFRKLKLQWTLECPIRLFS